MTENSVYLQPNRKAERIYIYVQDNALKPLRGTTVIKGQ